MAIDFPELVDGLIIVAGSIDQRWNRTRPGFRARWQRPSSVGYFRDHLGPQMKRSII